MSGTASRFFAISRSSRNTPSTTLSFQTLPEAGDRIETPGLKSMSGHPHRHRIRLGNYRVGIRVEEATVEMVRVLDRRDFYRYFP